LDGIFLGARASPRRCAGERDAIGVLRRLLRKVRPTLVPRLHRHDQGALGTRRAASRDEVTEVVPGARAVRSHVRSQCRRRERFFERDELRLEACIALARLDKPNFCVDVR
jgi:hypothetical protein